MCRHPQLYSLRPTYTVYRRPARIPPEVTLGRRRHRRVLPQLQRSPHTLLPPPAAHARDRGAQRLGPLAAAVDIEGDTAAVPLLGRGHHRPCERGPGARGARVAGRVPGGDVEL